MHHTTKYNALTRPPTTETQKSTRRKVILISYLFASFTIMLAHDSVIIILHAINDTASILALQTECDIHVRIIDESDLVQRACAVDLFEDSCIGDNSPIRLNMNAYLSERWRNISPSESDQRRIKKTIFTRLPGIIRGIHQTTEEEALFLFNEHYIVKPSAAEVEFGWHVDEDKQLGLVADDIEYMTMWIPLDEVSLLNGSLVFPSDTRVIVVDARDGPFLRTKKRCREINYIERVSDGISLRLKEGSAVLFSSKISHRSGQNTSGRARRVFYTQYSRRPITVAGSRVAPEELIDISLGGCRPLAFAVRSEPGLIACTEVDRLDGAILDDEG